MKTIGDVLSLTTSFLTSKGVGRARLEAEILLAEVLGCKRLDLYMRLDLPLEEKELAAYRLFVQRRGRREPWQYIVGEVEFFGARLALYPSVLIPRQETEILASLVAKQVSSDSLVVWDLCCGSGCLGISLKKAKPNWDLSLSDISSSALCVAQENAAKNGVLVSFYEGDLLAPFQGKKADMILCNPPYVKEDEFLSLDPEVKEFEPKGALVSGPTGLEFYERLSHELPFFLNPYAKIFLEIGESQGEAVLSLFSQAPWKGAQIERDWAGKDRFIRASFG